MAGKKGAKSAQNKTLLRRINSLKGEATKLAKNGNAQGARAKLLEALLITPPHWESVF